MSIWEAIQAERRRQDEKFGVQDHSPEKWLAILVEEVGEVAQAILQGTVEDYREEVVQVAAVAVAILEAERRKK